MAGFKGESEDK
jgi:hypothetical protein